MDEQSARSAWRTGTHWLRLRHPAKALPKSKSQLVPVPFLEQIGNGIFKAGQEIFALEQAAGTDKLALSGRMTDFYHLFGRINDPGDLRAAGKEVFEPPVDLGAGIVLGQHLDCQIGGAGEEPCFFGRESKRDKPAFGNKDTSGARQLRLNIQKPVLESRTAASRWARLKVSSAKSNRVQIRP